MTVTVATAAGAPLLMLPAGDGPWAWRRARYELLDGALDEHVLSYSIQSIRKLRSLGSAMRTENGQAVTFEFDEGPPLPLDQTVTHEEAGVGSRLWESAIALALFDRSRLVPFPPSARLIELGAGLGLPSFDLARIGVVRSVVLTDERPPLLRLAEQNAAALKRDQPVPAAVSVAPLQWGPMAKQSDDAVLERGFEVVIGSDICYEEESVPPLVELIERMAAPLALLIGPAGRPSMRKLRERLEASPALTVEERLLTLVCSNADEAPRDGAAGGASDAEADSAMVRSGGIHRLLVVRPAVGI